MTYNEVKSLELSRIVVSTDLKKLTKQCLSVMEDSTLKDKEILMLINAAVLDMKRLSIDVEKHITEPLIQGTIIMFVKANFGMIDIKEKEYAQKTYIQNCSNLSLSSEYKLKEGVDKNV